MQLVWFWPISRNFSHHNCKVLINFTLFSHIRPPRVIQTISLDIPYCYHAVKVTFTPFCSILTTLEHFEFSPNVLTMARKVWLGPKFETMEFGLAMVYCAGKPVTLASSRLICRNNGEGFWESKGLKLSRSDQQIAILLTTVNTYLVLYVPPPTETQCHKINSILLVHHIYLQLLQKAISVTLCKRVCRQF